MDSHQASNADIAKLELHTTLQIKGFEDILTSFCSVP